MTLAPAAAGCPPPQRRQAKCLPHHRPPARRPAPVEAAALPPPCCIVCCNKYKTRAQSQKTREQGLRAKNGAQRSRPSEACSQPGPRDLKYTTAAARPSASLGISAHESMETSTLPLFPMTSSDRCIRAARRGAWQEQGREGEPNPAGMRAARGGCYSSGRRGGMTWG